ncbi:MAG: ABC transporter ATP-binding protein [Oligoflexia bacterium]|nr:ABC transporter ATP-binding protein [Oligoflexia bacterium]
MIMTILSIAVKTALPLFLKHILDQLSGNFESNALYKLIILFALFIILHEVITRILPTLRGYLNMIYASSIRSHYYKILCNHSQAFFKRFKTGDLITRLTDDIDGSWERVSWYACSGILRPVEAILVLAFTLSVMFYYSILLSVCSFLLLPFLILILAKVEHKLFVYTAEKQRSISRCNEILEAFFSGIRVIKITQSEEDQQRKYKEVLEDRIKKEKDFLKLNQVIHLGSMLINNLGTIIVIFLGSVLVIQGKISIGTILLFMIYHQRLIEPLWTLVYFYATSKQVFRYVDRLKEIEQDTSVKDVIISTNSKIECQTFTSLEFKNVYFKHPDETSNRNILNGISFSLSRGQKLAILGKVGEGKTTLLELLANNYTPTSGEILLNGIPLQKIHPSSLSKIIGYVRQENILFSESIEDNIILGNSFSKEEIYLALKNALVLDEMLSTPSGLASKLGTKGLSLSGGQKQRLSLARTLIRRPQLLLMDDVTAAMDAITEDLFWKQFHSEYNDITTIIVTHRMTTASKADVVLRLHNGQIIQD